MALAAEKTMNPHIEEAHANSYCLTKYPERVGPRKEPSEKADVKKPDTSPSV